MLFKKYFKKYFYIIFSLFLVPIEAFSVEQSYIDAKTRALNEINKKQSPIVKTDPFHGETNEVLEYFTKPEDTIWTASYKLSWQSGIDEYPIAISMFENNTNAFIDNDPKQLKPFVWLHVPVNNREQKILNYIPTVQEKNILAQNCVNYAYQEETQSKDNLIEYTTLQGDTIWSVTEKLFKDIDSLENKYVLALSIYYNNPDAFFNGDIKQLQANKKLTVNIDEDKSLGNSTIRNQGDNYYFWTESGMSLEQAIQSIKRETLLNEEALFVLLMRFNKINIIENDNKNHFLLPGKCFYIPNDILAFEKEKEQLRLLTKLESRRQNFMVNFYYNVLGVDHMQLLRESGVTNLQISRMLDQPMPDNFLDTENDQNAFEEIPTYENFLKMQTDNLQMQPPTNKARQPKQYNSAAPVQDPPPIASFSAQDLQTMPSSTPNTYSAPTYIAPPSVENNYKNSTTLDNLHWQTKNGDTLDSISSKFSSELGIEKNLLSNSIREKNQNSFYPNSTRFRENTWISIPLNPNSLNNAPSNLNSRNNSSLIQRQVQAGESLWSIARDIVSNNSLRVSVGKMARSIYQNNPRAFHSGDINRIMRGAHLQINISP